MRIFTLCIVLCLVLLSCQSKNILKPELIPDSPILFTGDTIPVSNSDDVGFRQTISCKAPDQDALYAWKIITTDYILPEGVQADSSGWLIDSVSHSIWSHRTSLSFDFGTANGRISHIIAKVQMKCIKNGIEQPMIEVPFRTDRILETTLIAPFKDGFNIGTGVHISLHETTNLAVDGMYAHHFMYRLNRVNNNGDVLEYGQWYNSIDCEDIREIYLNATTQPMIAPNADNEMTQFEVYVVTRQGVEEATHHTIKFHAQSGHRPQTLIYNICNCALGTYHYSIVDNYLPPMFYTFIPSQITGRYNRPFFLDNLSNIYVAVNSPDLKINLCWGYHGQYGCVSSSGVVNTTNYPFDNEQSVCLDSLDTPYFAQILYYDLRLDNAPFPSSPELGNSQIITDLNGYSWRRVHAKEGLQKARISGLNSAQHRFEVRAVDSQGEHDLTPAVFLFTLVNYTPVSQRNGILIVDDDPHIPSFCPDATVDQIYSNVVPTQYGNVDVIDLNSPTMDSFHSKISPSNLLNRKVVIWHSDGGYISSSLPGNLDALYIFLRNGGKLVISGGQNLYEDFLIINQSYPQFTQEIFGIGNLTSYMHKVQTANSFIQKPWFISAFHEYNGYPDINLNTATPFYALITSRHGLGPVSYFDDLPSGIPLYKYGCKPPGTDNYSPDQTSYDMLSTKHVGYRFDVNDSKIVVFTFPLAYMDQGQTQQMLNTLIPSLIGNK
ncbi:MAG TPA: hypothetical protein PLE74_05305 [Candidatus Cloacimonadota bacterium]|nr:hypothetical protein [Candidatus Cloacimonadota bacterium]